jgi:DNA-binding HxlR family transcriptional regulator
MYSAKIMPPELSTDTKLNECRKCMLPVQDALNVLSGKWKLPIIVSLWYGDKRFSEVKREVPDITDRMLSKELKELEQNRLVKRVVYDTMPVTIEYSLTVYGKSLETVIEALRLWGTKHRQVILKKK